MSTALPPSEQGIFARWRIENRFTQDLPGREGNNVTDGGPLRGPTPHVLFTRCAPTPVSNPSLLCWSSSAAALLDLSQYKTQEILCQSPFATCFAQVFSGNRLLPGMVPYATRYGGHQFGNWAGQLGDGRALNLGGMINDQGDYWELQLKGAGPTPYARRGDGRAVLRSSLREFICSEAMWHLGVPTTRALCCVTTGEEVLRDMFYDGRPQLEPGAIVTRLAPSFVRFGHFEILAAQNEINLLRLLVQHVIRHYFPECYNGGDCNIVHFFKQVCKQTALLMVHWARIGFVHGVMNTDNMSVLSLTIDYGPYGWLDVYDSNWTPNTTDEPGRRYAFGKQPAVALWNLTRLAEALLPLVNDQAPFIEALNYYQDFFQSSFFDMTAKKWGLKKWDATTDSALLAALDDLLQTTETDMTLFYRLLGDVHGLDANQKKEKAEIIKHFQEVFYDKEIKQECSDKLFDWVQRYLKRCAATNQSPQEIVTLMNTTNPFFIPRNYLVQQALDELNNGSTTQLEDVLLAIKTPYQDNDATRRFFCRRPEWARNKPGCASLSCSS